jgi:hypothetical protein
MPIGGWFLICLGVLFGYCGRAMIYKQHLPMKEFWWIALPLLAFFLMLFVLQTGNKRNREKAGKLEPKRPRGIENRGEYWPLSETGDLVTPAGSASTSMPPTLEEEVGFERERAEEGTNRPLSEPEWNRVETEAYMAPKGREGENTLFSMEIMDFVRRLRMPRRNLT